MPDIKQSKWEEEFDKEFTYPNEEGMWHFNNAGMKDLKQFIKDLLAEERNRIWAYTEEYLKTAYPINTKYIANIIFDKPYDK